MHLAQIMRSVFNYTTQNNTVGYSRDPNSKNNLFIPAEPNGANLAARGIGILASGDAAGMYFMLPSDYSTGLSVLLNIETSLTANPMYMGLILSYAPTDGSSDYTSLYNGDYSLGSVTVNRFVKKDLTSLFTTIAANYIYMIEVYYTVTATATKLLCQGVTLNYKPTS